MSEEELIKETMMLDYSQLVMNNVYCYKEIERLNKKIEQYENPKDMTLMFMWCDDKAKDKIKRLNNIINELKLCNSDYYNRICTLSSKLSLINIYINENKNCVPKHISEYVNKVLFDKNIKLGDDKNEN